jgi:Mg2+ and Co2+ transporter CorA
MMFRLASSFLFVIGARASVQETWEKADLTLEQAKKRFAEVRKHSEEVAQKEQEVLEKTKKDLAASIATADKAAAKLRADEEKLSPPTVQSPKSAASIDSSLLELPDVLAKLPGVSEDMKRVHEAEKVYREKMRLLKQKDDELMALARGNYEDARKASSMVDTLRSETSHIRGSSFIQKDDHMAPYFARIVAAEEGLKATAKKIAKDFNLPDEN